MSQSPEFVLCSACKRGQENRIGEAEMMMAIVPRHRMYSAIHKARVVVVVLMLGWVLEMWLTYRNIWTLPALLACGFTSAYGCVTLLRRTTNEHETSVLVFDVAAAIAVTLVLVWQIHSCYTENADSAKIVALWCALAATLNWRRALWRRSRRIL